MVAPAHNYESRNILDLLSLKGKNAVVFGGARGIGHAICSVFAEAGANVFIVYNTTPGEKAAKEIAQANGVKTYTCKCDVTVPKEVEHAFAEIQKVFDTIDIVVPNNGICTGKSAIDMTYEEFAHEINVNLLGVFNVAHNAGPIFQKQGHGSLVATASMSGVVVNVPQQQCAYNTSKAGVIQLIKSLAVEWRKFARVNCVSPGYTTSDMTGGKFHKEWEPYTPFERNGLAKEIASAYLYLASDAASYASGTNLIVDGGYTSI